MLAFGSLSYLKEIKKAYRKKNIHIKAQLDVEKIKKIKEIFGFRVYVDTDNLRADIYDSH